MSGPSAPPRTPSPPIWSSTKAAVCPSSNNSNTVLSTSCSTATSSTPPSKSNCQTPPARNPIASNLRIVPNFASHIKQNKNQSINPQINPNRITIPGEG